MADGDQADDSAQRNTDGIAGQSIAWRPSEAEQILKIIAAQLRQQVSRQGGNRQLSSGAQPSEVLALAQAHLSRLEAQRAMFKQARALAVAQRLLLYAHDELEMAVQVIRLRQPGEYVLKHEENFKIFPEEIPIRNKDLSDDKMIAVGDLRRRLGTLRYLRNLQAARDRRAAVEAKAQQQQQQQQGGPCAATEVIPESDKAVYVEGISDKAVYVEGISDKAVYVEGIISTEQQVAAASGMPTPAATSDGIGSAAAAAQQPSHAETHQITPGSSAPEAPQQPSHTEATTATVPAALVTNTTQHVQQQPQEQQQPQQEPEVCIICHEVISARIAMMPCGHSTCLGCMEELKRSGGPAVVLRKRIVCPNCRVAHPLEEVLNVFEDGTTMSTAEQARTTHIVSSNPLAALPMSPTKNNNRRSRSDAGGSAAGHTSGSEHDPRSSSDGVARSLDLDAAATAGLGEVDDAVPDVNLWEGERSITMSGSYGSKVEAVVRRIMLITQADDTAKVVVFSEWRDLLELVAHALSANKVPHAYPKAKHGFQAALAAFKAAVKRKSLQHQQQQQQQQTTSDAEVGPDAGTKKGTPGAPDDDEGNAMLDEVPNKAAYAALPVDDGNAMLERNSTKMDQSAVALRSQPPQVKEETATGTQQQAGVPSRPQVAKSQLDVAAGLRRSSRSKRKSVRIAEDLNQVHAVEASVPTLSTIQSPSNSNNGQGSIMDIDDHDYHDDDDEGSEHDHHVVHSPGPIVAGDDSVDQQIQKQETDTEAEAGHVDSNGDTQQTGDVGADGVNGAVNNNIMNNSSTRRGGGRGGGGRRRRATWSTQTKKAGGAAKAAGVARRKVATPSEPPKVLLLLLSQGGAGLNLTEAQHVVLIEPSTRPAVELQAVGRIHRIGQTRETHVHRFIVCETVEENVHQLGSSRAAEMDMAAATATVNKVKEAGMRVLDVAMLLTTPWAGEDIDLPEQGVYEQGDDGADHAAMEVNRADPEQDHDNNMAAGEGGQQLGSGNTTGTAATELGAAVLQARAARQRQQQQQQTHASTAAIREEEAGSSGLERVPNGGGASVQSLGQGQTETPTASPVNRRKRGQKRALTEIMEADVEMDLPRNSRRKGQRVTYVDMDDDEDNQDSYVSNQGASAGPQQQEVAQADAAARRAALAAAAEARLQLQQQQE